MIDYEAGDRIVCVRPFDKVLPHTPRRIIPQVGCVYTAIEFEICFWGQYYLYVTLQESPAWSWEASFFRKVRPIEEPKYKGVKTPIKIPELV